MKEANIKQVAVIGAGMMGMGIGLEFARFGYLVNLYNTKKSTSQKTMKQAREDLDLMVETQLLTTEEAKATYSRLYPTTDFEKAAYNVDYVIESAPEFLDLKQDIFAKLDEMCPSPVILATNSSGLTATQVSARAKHPERILVTHYFGPPQFVPLVEVVKGQKTDPTVVEKTAQLLRGLRKKVVVVDIELVAHVGNRMQRAMSQEIHSLVDQGVPPEAIDDIITFGFGRRMPFIGYFKRMDTVGLDSRLQRYTIAKRKPWGPIVKHIERGELGVKSGKGFYSWPPGTAKSLDRRLKMELIRLMKYDMDKGLI